MEATMSGKTEKKDYRFNEALAFSWGLLKKNMGAFIGLTILAVVLNIALSRFFIFSFFVSTITFLGYFVCVNKLRKNTPIDYKDFFWSVTNMDRFLKSIWTYILTTIVALIGYCLLIIPGIYVSVLLFYANFLLFLEDTAGVPALKRSKELNQGYWFTLFFLFIYLAFINLAGLLFLGIGLFVTLPLSALVLLDFYDFLVIQNPKTPEVI